MKYEVVIGIETHLQLNTKTKMFCRCSADFWGAEPNSNVCPVCLGLPGALPVINKEALDKAMLMGAALGASHPDYSKFDRKNYFYPDLAKGYQISQFDYPLNTGGRVQLSDSVVGIIRAHLEEDTGKSSHGTSGSLIDFNLAGIPLLEVVSEPVIRSSAQAREYVQTLRQIARYIGVNEGNMERGMLRADINISLQEPGRWQYQQGSFVVEDGYRLHNRVEVKNLNSFRSIERAIEYEIKRQAAVLDAGEEVIQETRGWDEAKGVTTSQRTKEEAHDYRYFPEPDLPPISINDEWRNRIMSMLPELPQAKQQRFMAEYKLSEYNARLLTEEARLADWYETAVTAISQLLPALDKTKQATLAANWVLGEVSRLQNEHQNWVFESRLTPQHLAEVLSMIEANKISGANAKEVVAEAYATGNDPQQIVVDKGLEQVSGDADLEPIAQKVIDENPDAVEKIRAGKSATIQFLVGQVMKETRGRANPGVVRELLEKLLSA